MKLAKTIMNIINNPYILLAYWIKLFPKTVNDKTFIKVKYKSVFGVYPNLISPQTYNEKLQWLKLNDHNPLYSIMVDKYEAKKYVASIIGDQYIIPTLGVWDHFDDINFDVLPNQFVIKCTHDSGGLIICKDKSTFNISAARKKIEKCLRKNYFYEGREWPYKMVKPRILVEQYLEDPKVHELVDYKIFGFNGVPKVLFIATDRQKEGVEVKFDFFDTMFNPLYIKQGHPNSAHLPPKPEKFDEMLKFTALLSKGFPHIRVDFYEVKGNIYFGELTLYNHSGIVPFDPAIWDKKFGEWIDLSLAYMNKR